MLRYILNSNIHKRKYNKYESNKCKNLKSEIMRIYIKSIYFY